MRIIVPEAYGFKCVKWISHVVLTNLAGANDTYANENNDIDSPLKSFAATISPPRRMKAGQPTPLTGYAQVGMGGLSKVQVWLQPEREGIARRRPVLRRGARDRCRDPATARHLGRHRRWQDSAAYARLRRCGPTQVMAHALDAAIGRRSCRACRPENTRYAVAPSTTKATASPCRGRFASRDTPRSSKWRSSSSDRPCPRAFSVLVVAIRSMSQRKNARQRGNSRTDSSSAQRATIYEVAVNAGAFLVLAAIIGAVYATAIDGPFIYDDSNSIQFNPSIVRLFPLLAIVRPAAR